MCEHPGPLTPQSGELIAPVPVWILSTASSDGTYNVAAAKSKIYNEYLRVVETTLRYQLQAAPRPPQSWVASTAALVLPMPETARDVGVDAHRAAQPAEGVRKGVIGTGPARVDGDNVAEIEVTVAIECLVNELSKRGRFDSGFEASLRERDRRLQWSACPDPNRAGYA